MDHRGVGVTRVSFAVPDKKAGIADPESPDAATEFPCSLMPCDVICCCSCCCCCLRLFLCASAGIDAREGAFRDATLWNRCCCCFGKCLVRVYVHKSMHVQHSEYLLLPLVMQSLETWARATLSSLPNPNLVQRSMSPQHHEATAEPWQHLDKTRDPQPSISSGPLDETENPTAARSCKVCWGFPV